MTREEAIDIFEHNWTRLENHDYTEDELNEALNIAMQTLGAIDQIQWERDTAIAQLKDLGYSLGEKIEPCEDAISRQAVQDYIAKYLSQYLYEDVRQAVEVIDEYIGELPNVNPQEPKTGEWIADVDHWGDVVTTVNGYTCSECGVFNADDDNFCPNCGADMRGDAE